MTFIPESEFLLDIAHGDVEGHAIVNKFGRNALVNIASTPEDIWDGSNIWVPPTAARVHNIKSTNVNDIAGGTGMRSVRVFGLDANFDLIQEDVVLDGLANVATMNSYIRVFRLQGLTAGSNGVNFGEITALAVIDNTITALILPTAGQSLMAIYSVPKNKKAYLYHLHASINLTGAPAGAMADLVLYERTGIDGAEPILRARHWESVSISGFNMQRPFYLPKEFIGPCDILVRVAQVSDNSTDLNAGFDLVLIDD